MNFSLIYYVWVYGVIPRSNSETQFFFWLGGGGVVWVGGGCITSL